MASKEATPTGVWQYKASWRSSLGSFTILLLLGAIVMLLLALAGPRVGPGFLVGAVLFAALAWVAGKPLFLRDWIIRIGPRGISSVYLKGRTVPWSDVRDVAVQTVQGNTFLVLHLDPGATESLQKTRPRLGGRKPERRIGLNGLRKAVAAEAVAAALRTFTERGAAHAADAIRALKEEQQREAAFEHDLQRHTGTPWALYLVVALNVAVWLLNVATGTSPFAPATEDLFRWGANSAWAVSRDHDFWRLLTGTFLHAGAIHLLMNMLGLWSAGKLLNRMLGNGQFMLVYLLSAVAGASMSLHFGAQTAISVGASGAVFGVIAALVVAVRRRREHLPKALVRQIVKGETVFLIYALMNGLTHRGIDNAAHVGGLLAGALMGLVLAAAVDADRPRARRLRAVLASGAVIAAVAVMVATTPDPPVDHARMFAATAPLQKVVPHLQAVQRALQKDVHDAQAARLPQDQLLRNVEAVHLPALRRLQGELRQIPLAQGDPRADYVRDMLAITDKSVEALEIEARSGHNLGRPEDAPRLAILTTEVQVIDRRMREQLAASKGRGRP